MRTAQPSPEFLENEQDTKALCNLGTPEAARTFARLLSQGCEVERCLSRSPNAAAAIPEMERLLVDPDTPVPWQFFNSLVVLLNDAAAGRHEVILSQQIVGRERDTLFHALPQKHGDALASSLMTVLLNPLRSKGGQFESAYPLPFAPEVISAVVANFDRLPSWFQDRVMGTFGMRYGLP